MYVIFPAEELIYMTYGVAIPRYKPRPTLDNLREPSVPFDTLPNYKTTKKPVPKYLSLTSNINANNEQMSQKNQRYMKQNVDKDKDSMVYAYNRANIQKISGHQLEEAEDTKSKLTSISLRNLSSSNSNTKQMEKNNEKTVGKSKTRIQISLGRIGILKHQLTQPETARLRDITEIRIANPTFTNENIMARNYDAFFESGEPVYKLEYRNPLSSQIEPKNVDTENRKQLHLLHKKI